MIIAAILLAAFNLDFLLGEPPSRFHPVAWTGNWIGFLWVKRPVGSLRLFLWGLVITLSGIIIFALPLILLRHLPDTVMILISIPVLKLSFSLRNLFKAASGIQKLLEEDKLSEARSETSRHLVSRETSELTESEVAAAVIESTAENITDSFTSPMFFFLLLGLPGAWTYRFINTCDAMIGYRKDDYEWGGKFAARTDDILNFIPARLTTLFIMLAGIRIKKPAEIITKILRGRGVTDSPNAGWTMAAVAALMDIRLEKKGFYVINEEGRPPENGDIITCIKLCRRSTIMIMILSVIAGILIYGL